MRFILLLVLIAIHTSCHDPEEVNPKSNLLPENMDDLEGKLNAEENIQEEKDNHWSLYKKYRALNSLKALEHLHDLEDLAQNSNDYLYLGKSLFGQGYVHKNQQNYIQAVDRYLAAINALEQINEIKIIGSCLNNLGGIFSEIGNYEYAEKFYDKFKNIHSQSGDKSRLVLANLNLAICNYSKSEPNYEVADEYFQEAIGLADDLTEERDTYLNWIYNSIGAMHYKKGDYEYAKTYYLKSLDHLELSANTTQKKFIAFFNIGEAAIGADELTDADKYIEQALGLLQEGEIDNNSIIGARNIEAVLYQKKGDYEKAAAILEGALNIANTETVNPKLKETLKLLSYSYRNLNKSGRAVDASRYDRILTLKEAQEIFEKELIEKTNFKALQAALSLKIELDNQIKEKKAEMNKKSFYINLTLTLTVLLIVVAVYLSYRTKQAYKTYTNFRKTVRTDMTDAVNVVERWNELSEEEKMRLLHQIKYR